MNRSNASQAVTDIRLHLAFWPTATMICMTAMEIEKIKKRLTRDELARTKFTRRNENE